MIYLIFNDLANFFTLKFKKGEKDTIKAIRNYLEELLCQNNKEVTELVLFGFLENLKPENVNYEDIKSILTPKLLEYLNKIDKWTQKKINSIIGSGRSVNSILRQGSKSKSIFRDLSNEVNINVFFKNPINNDKLIRVTLDPTLDRIISAGFNRIKQVESWVNNGELINFTK